MRLTDYIEQSFSNLWKTKLRTCLTIFGVMIAVGALVSMMAFGKGVQRNVADRFKELELFNYINVLPAPETAADQPIYPSQTAEPNARQAPVLDDALIARLAGIDGVESAFPEVRFPAMIRLNDHEEFTFVQALPVATMPSRLLKLQAGRPLGSDEANELVMRGSFLRSFKINDPGCVIGKAVEVSTLTLDVNIFNPAAIMSLLQGRMRSFSKKTYTFTVAGVAEPEGFGGPAPFSSNVVIPIGAANKMNKLSLSSIWDLFRSADSQKGYSTVSVRVSSVKYIDPVKKRIEDLGLRTFALVDELQEMKTGFIIMDMFLFAVGMIGVTVACLGIANTMVMSILERYREIGVAKAVGAADSDIRKIFFFESATIGFLGGALGFILGWVVSRLINLAINPFLTRQGAPYVDYFTFPWWLFLGAVGFAVLVSLAAGLYPAMRAARVDPVVALRHD